MSLNGTNRLISIKSVQCVYCAVRTEISGIDSMNFASFSQVTNSHHLNASLLCDCYQKDEQSPSVSAFSLP
jgi:hypothetical protein